MGRVLPVVGRVENRGGLAVTEAAKRPCALCRYLLNPRVYFANWPSLDFAAWCTFRCVSPQPRATHLLVPIDLTGCKAWQPGPISWNDEHIKKELQVDQTIQDNWFIPVQFQTNPFHGHPTKSLRFKQITAENMRQWQLVARPGVARCEDCVMLGSRRQLCYWLAAVIRPSSENKSCNIFWAPGPRSWVFCSELEEYGWAD